MPGIERRPVYMAMNEPEPSSTVSSSHGLLAGGTTRADVISPVILTRERVGNPGVGGSDGGDAASLTGSVHLAQLRRKLEPNPSRPRSIITEAGIGYRLKTKPDQSGSSSATDRPPSDSAE